jgi:nucleoside phosphorylase/5'-deoxynucleotidase YfbR-like HD superfamily hydrolase
MDKPASAPEMNDPVVDIAIIFALKEEFSRSSNHMVLTPFENAIIKEKRLGVWYEVDFNQKSEKNNLLVIATFIGSMGHDPASNFTTRFLEHVRPRVLVNIGLSGYLSDDISIGDIVVASSASIYDNSSAIITDGKAPFFKLSGIITPTKKFKQITDHYSFKHSKRYLKWQKNSQKSAPELCEIQDGLRISKSPDCHVGPIASGASVIKNSDWSDFIRNQNRKYMAIDMESGSIAFANTAPDDDQAICPLYIIRAISDPASQTKDIVDHLHDYDGNKGAIRSWALDNAISFFCMIVQDLINELNISETSHRCIEESSESKFFKEQDSLLTHEVIDSYRKYGNIIIRYYEDLFAHFCDGQGGLFNFNDFEKKILSIDQENTSIAEIKGYPGTGKSTFLACLYLDIRDKYQSNSTSFLPIFFDLRNYYSTVYENPRDARAELRKDFRSLVKFAVSTDSNDIVLIIDGSDEYYRDAFQEVIDREIFEQLRDLEHSGKIIKIVGTGESDKESCISEKYSSSFSGAEKMNVLSIQRRSVTDSNIRGIVLDYLTVTDPFARDKFFNDIQNLVIKSKVNEIDIFTLSLLRMSVANGWHGKSIGIGSLYYEYLRTELLNISTKEDSLHDAQSAIESLAGETFDVYVTKGKEIKGSSTDPEILDILHRHPSLKEFLIAEHVINQIYESKIDSRNLLDAIFPYGINRFVKSIVNRTNQKQADMLSTIISIYSGASINQKAHLAYIAGRFTDRVTIAQARKFLWDRLNDRDLKKILRRFSDSVEFRQSLLLQRTIYISLTYLGDVKASGEYLNLLRSNQKMDALNRGFHLEYYEDLSPASGGETLISFDDNVSPPIKTFNVLYDKIDKDIRNNSLRSMTAIELHTLTSICLNRHVSNNLLEDHRLRCLDLLKRLEHNSDIEASYRQVVKVSIKVLSLENVNCGDLLNQLIRLRHEKRAGWNGCFTNRNGDAVERQCSAPESVAEHTLGCLQIAMYMLPNTHKEARFSGKYDKEYILKMLLIHDQSESITGDIPYYEKNDEWEVRENEAKSQISGLGCLDGFPGVNAVRPLWYDFKHGQSINSAIARDIDRLENYFTLNLHLSDPQNKISDADDWVTTLNSILESDIGREIFERFKHREQSVLGILHEIGRDFDLL